MLVSKLVRTEANLSSYCFLSLRSSDLHLPQANLLTSGRLRSSYWRSSHVLHRSQAEIDLVGVAEEEFADGPEHQRRGAARPDRVDEAVNGVVRTLNSGSALRRRTENACRCLKGADLLREFG